MRKVLIAVLLVVVAGGGGWWAYSRLLRDPIKTAHELVNHGDVRGAELELRNAILKNPDNATAHLELGRLQMLLGDAVAAEKELKAARAHGAAATDIAPLLARAYLSEQKFTDLLREFNPAGLPPADAAALLVSRSLAQLALHDLAAASSSAATAERLAPQMAEAPLAVARVAAASNDRGQAMLKVEQSLKLGPKSLEALGLKAELLRGQGNLVEALATLDSAVTVAPYLPQVRLARARALLINGDDSKARQDIDAALKADPKNTLGLYLDALLNIRAKEWQAANVSLQKIQPVLARLPRGEYYYALVKSNINQLEQASEAVQHYLARAKNDADGYRLLARVDLELDRRPEAAQALKQAGDLMGNQVPAAGMITAAASGDEAGPATPESLTRMAMQQLQSGDTGGAEQDLEQSLESQPNRSDSGVAQVLSALAEGDVERASKALERLAQQPKARPEVVGNLTGLVKMAELDFDGAEAAWADAVRAMPTAVPIRVNLARVQAQNGKAKDAEKTLVDILDVQPGNRAALRTAVDLFSADGQFDRAITLVQNARKSDSTGLGLLLTEAALDARKGDFNTAYNVLDQVPLEQALSQTVLSVRAQFLLAQGKKQEAADALRQILLNSPADLSTRRRLIELLIAMDHSDQALKLADDGLALARGNSTLMQLDVSLVYRIKGLDAALALSDKLIQDPLNLPTARLFKGNLYMLAKKYPEALAAYTAEMKDQPFTVLVVSTAAAMRAVGKPDDAAKLLRDWVAKAPDPAVEQSLASLDIEAGRLDVAQQNLESVLRSWPNDAIALNNLAWVYTKIGDKRAIALAQKAYLLGPSPQVADTLAWTMIQLGNKTKIPLVLLRRAAQLLPHDPTVYYHLAVALKNAGQTEEAGKIVAEIVDKAGDFTDRADALALQAELTGKTP